MNRFIQLLAASSASLLAVAPSYLNGAQKLTNIKSISLDAAVTVNRGKVIEIHNIRAISDQTTLSDYVYGKFTLSGTTLNFRPTTLSIYKNIGIFNDWYFAKDPQSPISMEREGVKMPENVEYSISGIAPFVISADIGHVLSFNLNNPSKDYLFELLDSSGNVLDAFRGEQSFSGGVITEPVPIMKKGVYRVRIRPSDGSAYISYGLRYGNANRLAFGQLFDDDYFSFSFRNNIRDYGKFRVYLIKGQVLRIPDPSDSNIKMSLLNSKSVVVASVAGLPLIHKAAASGTYHVFINNSKGWGGGHSGYVQIDNGTQLSPDRALQKAQPISP